MPSLSVADEPLLDAVGRGLGRLGEIELAERLLELPPHLVERAVGLGGDHRPDELEREPDRARLERRQARRRPERVAEQLLVHVDVVAAQLGVDRVAAAAEVHEVEQREVLLERLGRDHEAVDELRRRNHGLGLLAARCEEIREQRLQQPESLGRHRAGGPVGQRLVLVGRGAGHLRRVAFVAFAHSSSGSWPPRAAARRARAERRARRGAAPRRRDARDSRTG